jgi:signal transduction histidine kinase
MNNEYSSRFGLGLLISGSEEIILEHKIFNTASFIFFILSGVIAITALITGSSLVMAVSLSVISIIFLLVYYEARIRQRFLISSRIFVLLTLLFNDVAWCWSIMETPAANYFFILIIVLDLTILKVKDHLGFIIIAIVNLFAVDYLAFNWPETFLSNYSPDKVLTFPFLGHGRLASLAILLSVVMFFFKKNYERERTVSRLRSRKLLNANAALDHRNQHLESMARMVSHNLRSPMAGLKMIMTLYDKMDTPEKKEDLMDNFKEGATVLFDMVDDLSKIMMDYRELIKEMEELNLEERLTVVKKQLSQQIKKSDTTIIHDFSKYPTIQYSHYFLESIFLNLISNAIKYSRPGVPPIITLKSYTESEKVMLSVSDNGMGIDLSENGPKMFQMYKTFHNMKEVDSRGIGLFMTKNQVEMMGGKISVESTLGSGTTFYLELYRL